MICKADIDDFITQEKLAVVGVSCTNKSKMGNTIFKELKQREFTVYPVNPKAETIDGEKCYPDLKSLPEKVGGVILVVPPTQTEHVVKDAKEAGIKRVWMQYGAKSEAAIDYCRKNDISVIYSKCVLMFVEPVESIHSFHRWLYKLVGKYPK